MSSAADRLLAVEEALARVLEGVDAVDGREGLAPEAALGRTLAAPVRAALSLPPWDNSAMDGYAIRAADVAAASDDAPVRLPVAGEVAAGAASGERLVAGCALRIATGAPIPPGADAVVQVEATTPVDAAGRSGERGRTALGPLPAACLVHVPVAPGTAIRRAASDVTEGAAIVPAGVPVTPAVVALAAGSGNATVTVRRRPVVAVLATGDEIRPAGGDLGPAGIPDANGPGLRSLAAACGAAVVDLGIAPDRLDAVEAAVRRGAAEADLVVVSGGVSVGPYDVVRGAFERVGSVGLWRVAIQPGKPFAHGRAPRPGGGETLLFGLPGNPVSTFVTFELFVRPVLERLAGLAGPGRVRDRGVLVEAVAKSAGRRGFQRVVLVRDAAGMPRRDEAGRLLLRLAGGQGSHVLSGLAVADALAVVPEPYAVAPAGLEVETILLDR